MFKRKTKCFVSFTRTEKNGCTLVLTAPSSLKRTQFLMKVAMPFRISPVFLLTTQDEHFSFSAVFFACWLSLLCKRSIPSHCHRVHSPRTSGMNIRGAISSKLAVLLKVADCSWNRIFLCLIDLPWNFSLKKKKDNSVGGKSLPFWLCLQTTSHFKHKINFPHTVSATDSVPCRDTWFCPAKAFHSPNCILQRFPSVNGDWKEWWSFP